MEVPERKEEGERFLGELRGELPGQSGVGDSGQSVGRINGDTYIWGVAEGLGGLGGIIWKWGT